RNRLYQDNKLVQTSHWPRLNAQFHGSGCSLASAISAGIANGLPLPIAVTRAEVWLQRSLQNADFPHKNGQAIPRRI
ncbi:MAG TPA: bifunctional hydroxymethylpyrimidine kinase/phosphomethylpyrimidine kinase, partial [Agitococcus sp.]|nr:bifunctional hydroxymethylpyrimidine kinase/phosphomethylpyrimidine kinase [Agitococcus sp.]